MKTYTELIRHAGNQRLFWAIEMSVLAMQVNRPLHIHAEGAEGTGKSTVLRAARELLPPIWRIYGCQYNCHPLQPHCPDHFYLSPQEVATLGVERVAMPFLEISPSATIAEVAGGIDLDRCTDTAYSAASILPGAIPRAHRGIIFLDQINQWADVSPDLVAVILDVMGTKPGRVQIAAAGLPTLQIPVQVSVWAASNPGEESGPLEDVCSQLAACFDMLIRLERPAETAVVQHILQESQVYRVNPRQVICPDPVTDLWQQQQKFRSIGAIFDKVRMSEMIKNVIANIYLDFGLESLQPVEAMELGSRLHAALHNRQEVLVEDLAVIVPLVLAHRVEPTALEQILGYLDYTNFRQSIPGVSETIESSPNRG